ncbi:MAG: hypothetical protein CM15mP120_27300 [Pseudomonadota bacterium]|nr:MAG: hypothetical protein CM15mP120_27300 [Pseudomonadota bacterium]
MFSIWCAPFPDAFVVGAFFRWSKWRVDVLANYGGWELGFFGKNDSASKGGDIDRGGDTGYGWTRPKVSWAPTATDCFESADFRKKRQIKLFWVTDAVFASQNRRYGLSAPDQKTTTRRHMASTQTRQITGCSPYGLLE